ncbi:sensor histidine kinase [Streptomyces sp. YU58]|uniref:sensor histidine kinase n=1 Tax=Streptomyces sp. SX92 TaxID=3158972 RepID=UPI0027B928DD|nr:histidine kinase [Streptomyces coralus]WLW53151.1 histidine kinase [Streptomyces coralus]
MEEPSTRTVRALSVFLLWVSLSLPPVLAETFGLNEPRPVGRTLCALAVLAVAVASARSYPLTAFGLIAALSLITEPALFSVSYALSLGVLALLLGLRAPGILPATLLFNAVGCAGVVKIALFGTDSAPQVVVLMSTLMFLCLFPWLGGRHWRQSRELAAAGWTRAARLEGEQRIAEERARLRERARIAQDMHDSLGHELSLIALRAGALQVAPDLPAHHRTAAADLRVAAADATDRLHRIIGVLREDDEPSPLTPAGESVEQLVARAAESGLPVRWEPTGPPRAAPADGVAERLLHRVVREALTNAARHAPGAAVTVAATEEENGTTVTVTNGPATQGSSATATEGSGSGLLGLRVAVTETGGTFRAGPHGDGFRVRAHIPAQPASTAPRIAAASAPFVRARRRVAVSIGAVVCAGLALIGGAFGWYAYTETGSVLQPTAYAQLRLGDTVRQMASALPDRTARDAPVGRAPSPPPPGTDCRYYRASGELFVSVGHFRLCFDSEGRLVAKDVIPGVGFAGEGREEYEEFAG